MDTLPIQSRGDSLSPVIIKVPISPTEYYLIENRETEVAHKDTLYRPRRGRDSGFGGPTASTISSSPAPGCSSGTWTSSVIAEYGPYNAINIFPDHKGVDLVEGDGIQDFDGFSGRSSADYQIYG